MAKFKYDGVTYNSKRECLEHFGLNAKSVFEITSRTGISIEEYLDKHLDEKYLGKRGVLHNGVKYKSVKEAFKENGLTEDEYHRYMLIKKQKKDKGEIKTKKEEREFLSSILSGESDVLKKVYGKHIIDGIEYNSIEKMVESYGYTLEQYNIYKRYRKLEGNPVDIFNKMRQDSSFKANYSREVTYKGKTYPSIRALTEDLGYEYGIFTSRMYSEDENLTPEEFLAGIESGKYEEPVRKRKLEHKKINYIVDGKGYVTQEDIAKDLGIAKVTLIHKAHKEGLGIQEMAEKIIQERKEKEQNQQNNAELNEEQQEQEITEA